MMVRGRTARSTRPGRTVVAGLVAIGVLTLAPTTASAVAGRAAPAAAAGASAATPPPGSTGVYFEVLPSPTGSPTPDPQPTPHPTGQPTPHPTRQPLPVTGSDSGPGPLLALAAVLIVGGGILGVLGRRRVR
ncbi:LPXTG cell wall anchor domain-containing protein [Micromonospora sp. NPDC003241]